MNKIFYANTLVPSDFLNTNTATIVSKYINEYTFKCSLSVQIYFGDTVNILVNLTYIISCSKRKLLFPRILTGNKRLSFKLPEVKGDLLQVYESDLCIF